MRDNQGKLYCMAKYSNAEINQQKMQEAYFVWANIRRQSSHDEPNTEAAGTNCQYTIN